MLVELSYIFFSFLLLAFSAWYHSKRKERGLRYLTVGFTFLALSTTLHMFTSLTNVYDILNSILLLRLVELSGLAFFAAFIICALIAIREIFPKTASSQTTKPQ